MLDYVYLLWDHCCNQVHGVFASQQAAIDAIRPGVDADGNALTHEQHGLALYCLPLNSLTTGVGAYPAQPGCEPLPWPSEETKP